MGSKREIYKILDEILGALDDVDVFYVITDILEDEDEYDDVIKYEWQAKKDIIDMIKLFCVDEEKIEKMREALERADPLDVAIIYTKLSTIVAGKKRAIVYFDETEDFAAGIIYC